MAENATMSPPTLGTVLLVRVQACGAANFNGVLKLKGTLVITYTGYLSLDSTPPPKMATTQLHHPLSDLDSKYYLSP